jgi:hypothetical protein
MAVVIDGSNTPTAGGVIYGDGTEYASTSAGTSGQALLSAGSSAPTWGTPASATTATNLAGGSAGTVPYQSASGTTAMLAAGTSGQVLTSSGAGAPSWTTPSAGALVLLSAQTVSSAVTYVTFSNVFSSTYDNYLILFGNVAFNGSYAYTEGILQTQFEKSGSFQTTNYNGQYGNVWASPTNSLSSALTLSSVGQVDTSASFTAGTLYCFNVGQTAWRKQKFLGYFTRSGSVESSYGSLTADGAITGIRFLVESTNTTLVSGSFFVYGIAKS